MHTYPHSILIRIRAHNLLLLTSAAIELLVLATDIFDDISDHDQSDEIISHFIYRRNGHHCQYAYDGSISTHSS